MSYQYNIADRLRYEIQRSMQSLQWAIRDTMTTRNMRSLLNTIFEMGYIAGLADTLADIEPSARYAISIANEMRTLANTIEQYIGNIQIPANLIWYLQQIYR